MGYNKRRHLGKFISFIGIIIIALNQYFELLEHRFSPYIILGAGGIVLVMGLVADEVMR